MFLMKMLFHFSSLTSGPSKLYTAFQDPHRLQTSAFLQGHIALSQKPFGCFLDLIWTGHGLQQPWGIGVALLRLPFEGMARVFGFASFPDRLILLFYLTMMIIALNLSLRLILKAIGLIAPSLMEIILRWYFIAWIIFCPTFIGLYQGRSAVYEETVFYGCIFTYLLLSLFWAYLLRPNSRIFLVLSLFSGFIWLIRPDLVAYGSATFVIAAFNAYREKCNVRAILMGITCFCFGIFAGLWVNDLRFGSPFEFGWVGVLTTAYHNYMLRFDYPFHRESLLSAAKDLLGGLFFHFRLWHSKTFRFLEMEFFAYNFSHFIMFLLSVFFLFSLFLSKSFRKLSSENIFLRASYSTLFWALISFILLFMFYLRTPVMSARYLSVFSASIYAVLIAFIFKILYFSFIGNRRVNKSFILILLLLFPVFYFNNRDSFRRNHEAIVKLYGETVDNGDNVKRLGSWFDFNKNVSVNIPDTVNCHDSFPSDGLWKRENITNWGWSFGATCSVGISTSFFLPAKKCLMLNFDVPKDYRSAIQVKRDISFLTMAGSQMIKDDINNPHKLRITQLYCSDKTISNPFSLYSIRWVTVEKFDLWNNLPIVLNWVSATDHQKL